MNMHGIAEPVSRLIDEFDKLPGVGPKTAQRLAYFVLRLPDEEARRLAEAIVQVKERVVLCSVCFNVTERNPCALCANPARDHGKICVVEEPLDVTALERTGIYRGVYHVLHGALNPQDGIGPDDIKVAELVERVRLGGVSEVYSVTGEYDLIAMVRVREHEQLADVIPGGVNKVPGVSHTVTHVSFRTYSDLDLEAAFALGLD